MTMLTALIERLEKAEEGSRELSNDIAEAAGWERNDARSFVWKSPEGFAHHTAPDFSRSLDAANTLAPKGWSVSHAFWGRECSDFTLSMGVGTYAQGHSGKDTPALALAAAALKARLADGWAA